MEPPNKTTDPIPSLPPGKRVIGVTRDASYNFIIHTVETTGAGTYGADEIHEIFIASGGDIKSGLRFKAKPCG